MPGIKLLAQSLINFDFTDPNNFEETKSLGVILEREADQYLFGIVSSFANLIDNELVVGNNDPMWQDFGSQSVDNVINEMDLFLPLMRILEWTSDEVLEERTLKVIGFLCNCHYTGSNVNNFVTNKHQNIISLLHKSLVSRKMPKENLRATLFVLSNIIADKSGTLRQILELQFIAVLAKIWEQIVTCQPKDDSERK